MMIPRRTFLQTLLGAPLAHSLLHAEPDGFSLRYVLASALYGDMPLETILPEVAALGCVGLDVWCKVHGTQREQISEKGDAWFLETLQKHGVKLEVSTRYPLGPFRLQDEIRWVKKMGGSMVLCGCVGPKNPTGSEARDAIRKFLSEMEPHVAFAAEHGIRIAIENHSNTALSHPDSLRAFAEWNRSEHLGIAFAPHHLGPWPDEIPKLIRELGNRNLPFVYLQEHGEGASRKVAKEIELQQLPGMGGSLDYRPLLGALRAIRYTGLVELFMHPTPRGVPILPTVTEIREVLRKSRSAIDSLLPKIP
ncbi:MAG: hypothetical protein RLZZ142_2752 [Verrucomicrobiota bacterium]|jgi:sugar phosphate isomerase/epimerase